MLPNKIRDELNTPPKKTILIERYETPRKKSSQGKKLCSPPNQFQTPKKLQNPESKKIKLASGGGTGNKNPGSTKKCIGQFNLSRLDQDYRFIRLLGQGNFSSVGLYRSTMTSQLFAIKATKLSSMSVNEVQALATLSIFSQSSKNIVRYFYSWVESSYIYIVMQFCSHNLTLMINDYRSSKRQISQTQIKSILKQALQGLKVMHENKMVHSDIKPDNLLFKDSVLKISDLGLARISRLKKQSDLQEGDSRYLGRQLLNYHPSIDLTKSDIFSLGMTVYEAISLQNLPNNGEQWQHIRNNGLLLTSRMDLQEYTMTLLQILEHMTSPDWRNRPSASQILSNPYFKESLGKRSKIFAEYHADGKIGRLNKQHQRKKQSSL